MKTVYFNITFFTVVPDNFDSSEVCLELGSPKAMRVCTRCTPHPEPIEGAFVDDWDVQRTWEGS